MGSHSNKLEVLEIFNMNEKNVIAWFLFPPGHQFVNYLRLLEKWSRDTIPRNF